jgi:hypothetical protein
MVSNDTMTDELVRIWKEAVSDIIDVLTRYLSGGTEEQYRRLNRGVGVPAKIRTESLPNTSLQRYRHVNLLHFISIKPTYGACHLG